MAYNPPTDAELDPEKPGLSSVFIRLRDALTELVSGASGAPRIQTGAINDGAITNIKIRNAAAGTLISASAPTERNIIGTTYTKYKEISIGIGGTYTVDFDLKGDGYSGYGRIYVNGVPIGTERVTTSASYVTYSENITVISGDLVQLYCKDPGAFGAPDTRNFYVKESSPIIPFVLVD